MNAWNVVKQGVGGSCDSFLRAAHEPSTQANQLAEILRRDADTDFGRRHRFAELRNVEDFRQAVPLQTYESLQPYLSQQPAVAFEQTGGSTAGPKRIPYTSDGLAAIRRAARAWLDDLLKHRPGIMNGRCYLAISPVARDREVGVADTAYFGDDVAAALASLMAVGPDVALLPIDEWRRRTVDTLREASDLTLISVWSPTFWLDLFPDEPASRWPRLDTISCWTSASSAAYAAALASRYPGAFIQGKGLLATEGVVTIPLCDYPHPVLAIESGYYEFLDGESIARDPVCGAEYEVVMTTDSGLYRYRLGDRVRVHGFVGYAPMLEFIGRAAVSDLVGEKLSAAFVEPRLPGGFRVLAPCGRRYILFVDAAEHAAEQAAAAARALDHALCDNPQYRYARELGQLECVRAVRVPDAAVRYRQFFLDQGTRLSDIKPPGFHTRSDISDELLALSV